MATEFEKSTKTLPDAPHRTRTDTDAPMSRDAAGASHVPDSGSERLCDYGTASCRCTGNRVFDGMYLARFCSYGRAVDTIGIVEAVATNVEKSKKTLSDIPTPAPGGPDAYQPSPAAPLQLTQPPEPACDDAQCRAHL